MPGRGWLDLLRAEKGKVDFAVAAKLFKGRMGTVVAVGTVFQYKQALALQQATFQDSGQYFIKIAQVERRIGKNEWAGFSFSLGQYCKNIRFNNLNAGFQRQILYALPDEFLVRKILFNTSHRPGPSGGKLQTNGTGSCKQVQYFQFRKIDVVGQNIEKGFACRIGCRTGSEVFGW